MHKTKDQLYEKVKDIKTKKEFEEEIKKKQKEYDDLLDENTVAFLIVDELGRNKQNISKINDLQNGIECTVFGRITSVGESKSFNRKNGSNGKVINLELTDETGRCRLVLWDKDVDLVKNKTIKKGTNVKIVNAYVKNGFNWIELNAGRYGLIEIDPENMPVFEGKTNDAPIDKIRGTIVEKEPTRSFFKDNGEIGFVTNIKIRNEKGIQQITVWDEKVKEIQRFKAGDILDISNIDIRKEKNVAEIHLNGSCLIKKL